MVPAPYSAMTVVPWAKAIGFAAARPGMAAANSSATRTRRFNRFIESPPTGIADDRATVSGARNPGTSADRRRIGRRVNRVRRQVGIEPDSGALQGRNGGWKCRSCEHLYCAMAQTAGHRACIVRAAGTIMRTGGHLACTVLRG